MWLNSLLKCELPPGVGMLGESREISLVEYRFLYYSVQLLRVSRRLSESDPLFLRIGTGSSLTICLVRISVNKALVPFWILRSFIFRCHMENLRFSILYSKLRSFSRVWVMKKDKSLFFCCIFSTDFVNHVSRSPISALQGGVRVRGFTFRFPRNLHLALKNILEIYG